MRIRKPGVERKHRHLDGESEEERQEDPPLQVEWHVQLMEAGHVEAVYPGHFVVIEVHRENPQKHDDASDKGKQEELDGGVQPVRTPPDADKEIHRHQHHFPEHEEEQEVQGNERTDHPRLQQQKEHIVFLDPFSDRRP